MEYEEIWKEIPHYEGLYLVSNMGNVFSLVTKKVLKQFYRGNYLKVGL